MPLGTSAQSQYVLLSSLPKKVIATVGQTSVNSPTRMDYIAKQGKDGAGAQWRADRLPFLTDVWHCAQNTICLLQHTGEDLPAAWSPML